MTGDDVDAQESANIDQSSIRCFDCERDVSVRSMHRHEVPIDLDEGGYELVEVPLCPGCAPAIRRPLRRVR